jgi:hypothetical protein
VDFLIKQGDRREPIERVLRGSDGNPVDLTGASVRFIMTTAEGVVKVDAGATIVGTPTAGRARYSWGVNDTDTIGSFRAEYEVTFGDGTKQTFPNKDYIVVIVVADLG